VLVLERNDLAFQVRLWKAKSPDDFDKAVHEYLIDRLHKLRCNPRDVDTSKELHDMCEVMLGLHEELYGYNSFRNINIFDDLAAAAFHVGRKDLFREACEHREHMLPYTWLYEIVSDNETVAPHATAEVLGRYMFRKLWQLANNVRFKRLRSSHSYWKDVNWWVSLEPTLWNRVRACDLFIEAFESEDRKVQVKFPRPSNNTDCP